LETNGRSAQSENRGKVPDASYQNFSSDTAITQALERLASNLRQWLDFRLEEERRTIDIRVEKVSSVKAAQLTQKKLKDSQEWIQLEQQRLKLQKQKTDQIKSCLLWLGRWLGSGFSGVCFYFICLLIYVALGTMLGINLPSKIACLDAKSICFLLRLDKSKVVIPHENQKPRYK
jgi:Flp pilus assembly protein TadB